MGVVVGVLAISFAIWGIGDIFRGGGRSAVASVGGTEISSEQFRQLYTERLQQIGQQMGRPIPFNQARDLGIDRQILGQIVSETALDEWAKRIGLGITDAEVARLIRSFPAFQGPDGQFDNQIFLQRLRSAGYTEARFVTEQRKLMIRQHLTESVGGTTIVPKTYADVMNAYQNEQRSLEYVTLTAAQAGEIADPTPEQLTTYFDSRKQLFRAPEYRRIVIVRLSPEELAKWTTIADEDARKAYDERRARFTQAGQRQVQQIVFPSEEEARAAKKRLDEGLSFADLAKERGLSETDIDLGMISRETAQGSRFTKAMEEAFKLPEGGVSNPVQARLGYALVRVAKIEPDSVRPYEQVADELKQELARERTRNEVTTKHDKLEDERAGGANLTESAQRAGLQVTMLDGVDRSGRDATGALVTGIPQDVDILTPAFAAQPNTETEALRPQAGGYVWFEVTEITPSKERTLDEVKDRVVARWKDDQIGERLRAKANEMVEKLKANGTFAELAAADKLNVATAADLRRSARPEGLPPGAVITAFQTPKGAAASTQGQLPAERIVFKVTDIKTPPFDANSDQGKQVENLIRTSITEDLLRQYIAYIEKELKATVNVEALRRVSGGGVEQ
ncbi:peptidyl-prolyl cis-trans isomerase D [Variibacter gotjawalensis]|nr:peptidyl-prolyl cis-trans isomerase D [Variibacter gotjawalensis]